MDKIQKRLDNLIDSYFFRVTRNSFISISSLVIVSSFFILVVNFPFSEMNILMTDFLGEIWTDTIPSAATALNSFISLYLVCAVSYFCGKEMKIDAFVTTLSGLFSFLLLMPIQNTSTGDIVLSLKYVGVNSIFLAILVGFISTTLLNWFTKKKIVIHLPKSVPKDVAASFENLIPLLFVTIVMLIIKSIFLILGNNASDFIYALIQEPITNLGSSLPSVVFINLGVSFLWFFGFNGSYIFNSIMNPVFISLSLENLHKFELNEELPNIVTGTFQSVFINYGGSGSTLALIIAILLFSKKKQSKSIAKIALIPGIFNINEPIVYGYPVILNMKIFAPFVIMPVINTIISYYAMFFDIVDKTNGIQLPWTTPTFISGFLVSGISGVLLQLFLLTLNVVVYIPFLKGCEQEQTLEVLDI